LNPTAIAGNLGFWEMVVNAGPVVKLVLLVLLIFSVFSWAIIIYKMILLRKVERESSVFYDAFWEKRQFSQILAEARAHDQSPLARMFRPVYTELSNMISGTKGARVDKGSLERLERILRKTGTVEKARLEYAVSFLATAGNTAPFIGLFGTVWGIMASFRDIGALGTANLAVVAPGISEALVATAMGLAVAIPAVVGYNHILSRIDRIATEMENFSSDLINIIEKQLHERGGRDKDGL